ncbi:2'-5'-oligoadenylate synthase 2-like isoform X2 [Macrotis lagotis]|uniref:2'-5'-oligoadenylate synthase 2-like isoform X2 n=1 Tax=Macrotis lagotis TaxID=92651 RepID=UPI003D6936F8
MSDSFQSWWNDGQQMSYSDSAKNLDQFIQNELQPQEKYLQHIDVKIDNICEFLEANLCRPVKSIILGGSYGRDTVLKGQSDGTFVIFLEEKSEVKSIKWNLIDWEPLAAMGNVKIVEDKLQLVLSESELCITFDVLPIISTFVASGNRYTRTSISGYKPSPDTYKKWINSKNLDLGQPVHFTQLQGNFFKYRPRKLKNLILLVKHWYQQYQKRLNQDSFPLQYALELLTVYVWEQMCESDDFNTVEGFLIILKLITQYNQLCVYWTVNYNFEDQTIRNYLQSQLRKERPIILDPADPTSNVSGKDPKLWKQLAKEAKAWLSSSSFVEKYTSSWTPRNVLPALLQQTPSWDLDNFNSKFLQPDKQFQDQVSRAVDIICSFLKENCFWNSSIKILRIVQGGSFATGTALKGKSDVKLVVFLSCPSEFRIQGNNHVKIIREIHIQLEACQREMQFDVKFEVSNSNNYRLNFTLMSKTLEHRVDFLVHPTFDVFGQWVSKYQPDPEIYIKLIKSPRRYFDGVLTELQRDFSRSHPTKLKNLICLMKYWYQQCERKLKKRGCFPPEKAIELLTVYAWEQGSGMEDFDTAEGFLTVLKLIMQFQELCLYWTVNYDFQNKIIRKLLMTQLKKTRPLILDPIDPIMDVGDGKYTDWNPLAQEAKIWSSSLCFKTGNFDPVKPWPVLPVLLQQTPSWDLDNFIRKILQSNKEFQDEVSRAVNIICSFLKENCFWNSSIKILRIVQVNVIHLLLQQTLRFISISSNHLNATIGAYSLPVSLN